VRAAAEPERPTRSHRASTALWERLARL